MKNIIKNFLFIFMATISVVASYADTETLEWYVDDNVYTTTTCESGDDIILPSAPTKTGYTFLGWEQAYYQIEYLESTGTQVIDTGIVAKNTINIETMVDRPVSPASGTIWRPFGSENDPTNGQYTIFESSGNTPKYIAFAYGKVTSSALISNGGSSAFPKSVITITNGVATFDNGAKTITSPQAGTTFNSGHNLFLFGRSASDLSKANVRMYYFKIWDNGTLVRDFIPTLDENNIPCMYDKVTDEFFYNSGTGDFSAGPVITE